MDDEIHSGIMAAFYEIAELCDGFDFSTEASRVVSSLVECAAALSHMTTLFEVHSCEQSRAAAALNKLVIQQQETNRQLGVISALLAGNRGPYARSNANHGTV
jgi:hypothetical protein